MCVNGWNPLKETHNQGVVPMKSGLGPLNNQPLTKLFVGGFFFGASLAPGFGLKVGVIDHRSIIMGSFKSLFLLAVVFISTSLIG